MTLILIFLIAGIMIGYFDIVDKNYLDKFKLIPFISLLFILFLMGSKIGMDPKIFKNINVIGFKAFIIALGSIGGSLLCIKLMLGKADIPMEGQEE